MKRFAIVLTILALLPCLALTQNKTKVRERAQDAHEELESGRLTLRFFNALNGLPIKGGRVSIEGKGEFTTDFEGKVVFEAPDMDGLLPVAFRAPGFITSEFNVEIMNGSLYFNRFSVSPIMDVHHVRVVLDWGEEPRDLDLHFMKEGGYHISYRNMRTLSDGSGQLDRDDTRGYGPETITVNEVSGSGRYECFVHNYSDRNDSNSDRLSLSRATVKLYAEGRLIQVFTPPRTGTGTVWHVFELVGGSMSVLGSITP
jgi:hypothetical protein